MKEEKKYLGRVSGRQACEEAFSVLKEKVQEGILLPLLSFVEIEPLSDGFSGLLLFASGPSAALLQGFAEAMGEELEEEARTEKALDLIFRKGMK